MIEPVKLKTNEFWGNRSGSVTKDGDHIIKGKKWANGSNNSATRKRTSKEYSNKKLRR